jgi:putative tryptophan/tyrosine transport system substrate-binding protein
MRRRRLLLLFGGAAIAWPLAAPLATIAHAQKRSRISILHSGFPNRTPIPSPPSNSMVAVEPSS